MARLRVAVIAAQVDPTEQGFGPPLRRAMLHQRGLSEADSLLLDGYAELLSHGDGETALARFKSATERAPDYPQAWYVLGEFYYHFGELFDQSAGEARPAFDRVLDLDPRFSPAIGHLIALANQVGDRPETGRLIRQYLRVDSTSLVAEVVGIADTLILGSVPDQVALLRHVCGHSFLEHQSKAFKSAAFGTPALGVGPARRVLRCLEQRAATDQERVRVLRMGLAADLAAGWVDSARARLGRAGPWAERERDLWLVVMPDVRLPGLGGGEPAAARLATPRSAAQDSDVTAHWALGRGGLARGRHAGAS